MQVKTDLLPAVQRDDPSIACLLEGRRCQITERQSAACPHNFAKIRQCKQPLIKFYQSALNVRAVLCIGAFIFKSSTCMSEQLWNDDAA